jgi:hypothetical protein
MRDPVFIIDRLSLLLVWRQIRVVVLPAEDRKVLRGLDLHDQVQDARKAYSQFLVGLPEEKFCDD